MEIPVLVELINGNGYRATSGSPFSLCADGATREDALAKVREQFEGLLNRGATVAAIESGPQPHPLAGLIGIFKDDPWIDDWKKSVAAYRRKTDKDANRP
jgi:hypothetical protein